MVRGEGQGIVVHSLQRLCTLDIHGCTHAQGVKQEGELFHSGLCGLSGHGLLDVVLIQGLCQLPEGAFCGVPLLLGKTGQVIGKGVGQGLKLLCVGRGGDGIWKLRISTWLILFGSFLSQHKGTEVGHCEGSRAGLPVDLQRPDIFIRSVIGIVEHMEEFWIDIFRDRNGDAYRNLKLRNGSAEAEIHLDGVFIPHGIHNCVLMRLSDIEGNGGTGCRSV